MAMRGSIHGKYYRENKYCSYCAVMPNDADADGGAPTGATAAQQGAKDAGVEAMQAEAEADVDEIDDAAHVSL
jgi:hypothetical protein